VVKDNNMNIDPHTGKNYGLPPTADDLRNYAAEVDDRDEATQEQLDMLRLAADRLEQLERERDEARRMYCYAIPENCDEHEARKIAWERGWDCYKEDGK
jgi:hypothetical protein